MQIKSKVCSKCKKRKKLDKFSKDKYSKTGLKQWCKKCCNKHVKKYIANNKDRIKAYGESYRKLETTKVYMALYNKKPEQKAYRLEYEKTRYNSDPIFNLLKRLRVGVRRAFKKQPKTKRSAQLLGCTIEEAKAHIERQFQEGMSWDNHGKWHIDHIKPLASAKTKKQAEELCHYTNLQPLWAEDNLKKGAKYESV